MATPHSMTETHDNVNHSIQVTALPALSDNYIWLLRYPQNHRIVIVDPGDARPVVEWLESDAGRGYSLDTILVTHHHDDHTAGVAELVKRYDARVIGPRNCRALNADQEVGEGDQITLFEHAVSIMHTPGHTLDHIVYLVNDSIPLLLCGDTLFHAGCGRLFEGSPEQMQANFERLRKLPANTRVYGAHEYSVSNLRFAKLTEPDNTNIDNALEEAEQRRQQHEPTLPSTIEKERAVNPFMRFDEASVLNVLEARIGHRPVDDVEAFALLREWKDNN